MWIKYKKQWDIEPSNKKLYTGLIGSLLSLSETVFPWHCLWAAELANVHMPRRCAFISNRSNYKHLMKERGWTPAASLYCLHFTFYNSWKNIKISHVSFQNDTSKTAVMLHLKPWLIKSLEELNVRQYGTFEKNRNKLRVSLTFLKYPFSTGPLVLQPLGIRVSVISEFSTDSESRSRKKFLPNRCVSPRRSQISVDAPSTVVQTLLITFSIRYLRCTSPSRPAPDASRVRGAAPQWAESVWSYLRNCHAPDSTCL